MKENCINSLLLICKKTFGCPGGLRKRIMSVNDFKKKIIIFFANKELFYMKTRGELLNQSYFFLVTP